MNKSESQRLGELETQVEVIEAKCEDCKDMQDERLDTTNRVLGELKGGQKDLVEWHIKNIEEIQEAKHGSAVTTWKATAAIITAVGIAAAAILKFAG